LLSLLSLEGNHLVSKTWLFLLQGTDSSLQVIVLIWRSGLFCKAQLFLMGSFSPWPYYSLIPRWLLERTAQSKGQQVQNGDGGARLFSCF
jgi:hypothetical protein